MIKVEIEELTVQEKIGQMSMIGIDTNYITDETKMMIQKYKVGGFILYRKNYKNYTEMISMIKQLKELNKENKIPLFIAIDQEGGRVNRMPKEILNLPSAYSIAKTLGLEGVKKSAEIIRENVKKFWIQLKLCTSIRH